MGIWEIVVGAVVLLLAVIMIIVIILQEGHDAGLGTVTGGADSFMGKGKARTADAVFAKVTKYCAIAFFVVVVLLNALSYFGLTGKADNGAVNKPSQTVTESSVESAAESSVAESSVAESSAAESSVAESSVAESSAAESSQASATESSAAVTSSTASAE
ncbi:MAG: preprotein translocase subunit SecG [Acutalibacteraceae bacterium]